MSRRLLLLATSAVLLFHAALHAEPAPPAPVPATGQKSCYRTVGGGTTDCAGSGQDGEKQAGVPWPDPRYEDDGGPTLTDRLTGLAWSRDADAAGEAKSWQEALDFVKALNRRSYLGHDDWRLPNVIELRSLVNRESGAADWLAARGFRNVRKDDYWTSTSYAAYPANAWAVGMQGGLVAGRPKSEGCGVWPVRGTGTGAAPLPKSGQASCYDAHGSTVDCSGTGQDGALQAGAAWRNPRFKDNGDRTATDGLTGLVWSRDASAPGPPACNPGTRKDGQGALDYIRCLNANRFLGRNDWRLPNINELASMVDHGQPDVAAWLGAQGFSGVQAGPCGSSSSFAATPWNAWGINLHDGAESSFARKHEINVWPVR